MSKRRKRRTPQAGDEREAPRDATAAWPVSVRRTLVAVGVAGLLGAHFLPAATSIRHKCCTFDEIAHVTRGYSFWNHRDKRLISHHPPLAYAWATLPLLNDELEFPSFEQDTWYQSDVYALGKEFFYRLGNDPDAMLRQARLMITALSVALGLCVFVFSRRRFGTTGAFVSLILYTFSPTILAHARLATTDIPASLFFLLSVTSIWWMLHRVSIVSVLVGAAALAGLFLTKMSAVVVIPMSLILLVIRLIVGKPLAIKLVKEWTLTARWKMAPVFLGVAFTYVLVVYAAIWGAYGFRYESMVGAEPGRDRYYAPPPIPVDGDIWEHEGRHIPEVASAVNWMREHRLFPEAYLYMTLFTRQFMRGFDSFLDGERSTTGWRKFFPLCFAYKVPLAVMGVILMALLAAVRGQNVWHADRPPGAPASRIRRIGRGLYETAPFWSLCAVYWAIAINSNLNIGHRHLTPTFAPMFILCGAAGSWILMGRLWQRALVPVLLGALAVVSLGIRPDYLAFFNSIAGGPKNGYRHLVDSSLDWGQDLPGLVRWLEQNLGNDPVRVAYFGTGNWNYYGVKAIPIPYYLRSTGTGTYTMEPGLYCISATRLQQLYLLNTCKWTEPLEQTYQSLLGEMTRFEQIPNTKKARTAALQAKDTRFKKRFDSFQKRRFARLCAYLRRQEPIDQVGHSILIYRLSQQDLEAALLGPPPFEEAPESQP